PPWGRMKGFPRRMPCHEAVPLPGGLPFRRGYAGGRGVRQGELRSWSECPCSRGREPTPCSARLMSARSGEGVWGGGSHQEWRATQGLYPVTSRVARRILRSLGFAGCCAGRRAPRTLRHSWQPDPWYPHEVVLAERPHFVRTLFSGALVGP